MDLFHLGVVVVPKGNSENQSIWLAPGSGGEATIILVTAESRDTTATFILHQVIRLGAGVAGRLVGTRVIR